MKVIIGEAAKPGAGKETVGDFIAEAARKDGFTVSRHRFSDILTETFLRLQVLRQNGWATNGILGQHILQEILKVWNLANNDGNISRLAKTLFAQDAFGRGDVEPNTPNKQILAQVMVRDTAFGASALADAVGYRLAKSPTDIVIADGVRWLADEELIRALPQRYAGIASFILYVTAPLEKTFERVKKRARDEREAGITREEWQRINQAKNEIDIPEIGSRADFHISNEGTLEELERKTREFYEKKLRPVLKDVLNGLETT